MRQITIEPTKTYATEANAAKAIEAKFGSTDIRYFIMRTAEGRFFPVALGAETVQAGIHFHFNCAA